MMDREKFKLWFRDFARHVGVSYVDFRRLDKPCPFDEILLGEYSFEDHTIWVIEEWSDYFVSTEDLIYYSLHELGHHMQWLRNEMDYDNEDGWAANRRDIPDLERDAHLFASITSEPLLDQKLGPLDTGEARELFKKETPT